MRITRKQFRALIKEELSIGKDLSDDDYVEHLQGAAIMARDVADRLSRLAVDYRMSPPVHRERVIDMEDEVVSLKMSLAILRELL